MEPLTPMEKFRQNAPATDRPSRRKTLAEREENKRDYMRRYNKENYDKVRPYRRDWMNKRRDVLAAWGYARSTALKDVKEEHQDYVKNGIYPQEVGVSVPRATSVPVPQPVSKPPRFGNEKWRALEKEDREWRRGRKYCKRCGQQHLRPTEYAATH